MQLGYAADDAELVAAIIGTVGSLVEVNGIEGDSTEEDGMADGINADGIEGDCTNGATSNGELLGT